MSPTGMATGPASAAVDHDRAAATGRTRRLIDDIDGVRALAAAHGDDDADWREVTLVLERLRANLSRDLHRPRSR